jgi:hypothetical protein
VAASQAVIEWSSKDAQVLRSMQAIERGMQNLAREQDKLRRATERASQDGLAGFEKWAGGIRNVAGAIIGAGGIVAAFNMAREAQQKALQEAEEAGKKYDEIIRKIRVQAGLTQAQGQQAQARVQAAAVRNAVDPSIAGAAAQGLIGAGFGVQDATGPALDVLLRTQAAYNAAGKSPVASEQLAKQAAAYLTSQSQPMTAANMQRIFEQGFALRAGAFELSDFGELAKQGGALQGKLTQQEQLAAFGTLVDVYGSAEAGTNLRNIVSRLSTSRVGRTSPAALKELGLKPEDVDLVGENFGTVLDRLAAGVARTPEEKRAGALKQLFEEAGVAPAMTLINERMGKYSAYQRGMGASATEFAAGATTGQAGRNAAEIRMQASIEGRRAAKDAGDDLVLKAMADDDLARGVSGAGSAMGQWAYWAARGVGLSQETSLGLVGPTNTGFDLDPRYAARILRRVEQEARGEVPPGMTSSASIEERLRREEEARRRAEAEAARRLQQMKDNAYQPTDEGGLGGFTLGPSRIRTRVPGRQKAVEVRVVNPGPPVEQRERVHPSAALGK